MRGCRSDCNFAVIACKSVQKYVQVLPFEVNLLHQWSPHFRRQKEPSGKLTLASLQQMQPSHNKVLIFVTTFHCRIPEIG